MSGIILSESNRVLDNMFNALIDGVSLKENYGMVHGMSDEANELLLFIENDSNLYRQMLTPVHKNLMRKIAAKKYDHEKSKKLFLYTVVEGAKKYAKDYGDKDLPWNKLFSVKDRKAVAKNLADGFKAEADLGNYDEYIPKKYQKKNKKKR